jgi:hypothetical protein
VRAVFDTWVGELAHRFAQFTRHAFLRVVVDQYSGKHCGAGESQREGAAIGLPR